MVANEANRIGRAVVFALKLIMAICVSALLTDALTTASAATVAPTPTVVTESGPLVGLALAGENEYLGIPYAAPPVGRRRWMQPRGFGIWSGTLQATQFGNECPQRDAFGEPVGDEGCLFLNVYVPISPTAARSGSGLPVMVWIHGGSLVSGAGSLYDPTPLVLKGGVIVVTINYRLGLLGFFAHPAIDSEKHVLGNYGFMDQQFALRWVRRNIAAFGGNPKNVTMFGESAGGLSVYSNLASPLATGLFQKAIAESGSYSSFKDYLDSIIPLAQGETEGSTFVESGTALATAAGCPDQTTACLRALPATALLAVQPAIVYPFVDGRLLTQTPGAAFAAGQFNRVPLIAGTNHDEYRLFVALAYDYAGNPLTNAEYATAVDALYGPVLGPAVLAVYPLPANPPADAASLALGTSGTDGIFSCPARTADQALVQFTPLYTYEFNDENAPLSPGIPPASFPLGAYHSAEIQYLMNILSIPAPFTPAQQTLSNFMIGYWTQFAKTGNPNSSGAPTWSPYSTATDQFQSFVPPTPAPETTFATDHLCTAFWDLL